MMSYLKYMCKKISGKPLKCAIDILLLLPYLLWYRVHDQVTIHVHDLEGRRRRNGMRKITVTSDL